MILSNVLKKFPLHRQDLNGIVGDREQKGMWFSTGKSAKMAPGTIIIESK